MNRRVALLLMVCVAGVSMAAAASAGEDDDNGVTVHMVEKPRTLMDEPLKAEDLVPWKPKSDWQKAVDSEMTKANELESEELSRVDTVVAESTNSMTQSARCLMTCANAYGLCTRRNKEGCACAAGCMCNRGDAKSTCKQHCHPDNSMYFVYGYHDADHFSPHLWNKNIGDTLENYDHVRACLRGCAARGKCKARFCPKHPTGGYKCDVCKRMDIVQIKGSKGHKYYTVPHPKNRGIIRHRVTETESKRSYVDQYGQVHHYTHTNTHYDHDHYPRFAEQHAEVEAEAEAEAEAGTEAEAEAETEASDKFIDHETNRYYSNINLRASNIAPIAPRAQPKPYVPKERGADYADNGLVSDTLREDYDNFVEPGMLNPPVPYVYKPEARTTTFSTVPDLLEPRSETKVQYNYNA